MKNSFKYTLAATLAKFLGLALMMSFPLTSFADKIDTVVSRSSSNIKAGRDVQRRIDKIVEVTEKVISETQKQSKAVESLKVYNRHMQKTVNAQNAALNNFDKQIEDAYSFERQIVPLMLRMVQGLEKFVLQEDLPFKLKDRKARLERVKGYLTNANISASERFRQVLDAYSKETAYGTSIDVYRDIVKADDKDVSVNILQIGRTGLYYQTLDGKKSGYWDKTEKSWRKLAASYNKGIEDSIRIVQGKESVDLMKLPIIAPEVL